MFAAHREIKAIVEDCRSTVLGGLKVGIDIWEATYIPSLLNNCSTWMEIRQSTIDKLDEVQNSLYRSLLNVPFTTPKAALIWEVGGTKMAFRIMMHKLIFMNHILQEVKGFIAQLSLPNCFEQKIPQNTWKSLVKKTISKANEQEIRGSTEGYKKMKDEVQNDEKF